MVKEEIMNATSKKLKDLIIERELNWNEYDALKNEYWRQMNTTHIGLEVFNDEVRRISLKTIELDKKIQKEKDRIQDKLNTVCSLPIQKWMTIK